MLPQSAHQLRPHNSQNPHPPTATPFLPQNPSFDPTSLFNLDLDVATKQMSANPRGQINNVPNGRQLPSTPSSSASFHTGMPPSHNQASGLPQVPADPSHSLPFSPSVSHPGHSIGQPSVYPSHPNPSSFDSTAQLNPVTRQPPNPAHVKPKQSFLASLARCHITRGHPLPPALTGCPYPPGYDPANSPWKNLDCQSGEIGVFRLCGKDVDLRKLWTTVWQRGGFVKVTQQNGWPQIIRHFDLPDSLPGVTSAGQHPTAAFLARYYQTILYPFEEALARQEGNKKPVITAARPAGNMPNNVSNVPHPPGTASQIGSTTASHNITAPADRPISGSQYPPSGSPPGPPSQPLPQSPHPPQAPPGLSLSGSFGLSEPWAGNSLPQPLGATTLGQLPASSANERRDQDLSGLKRKLETEEADGKRAKLKTGGTEMPDPPPSSALSMDRPSTSSAPPTTSSTPRSRSQLLRTKVEYIPLAREVDTYGGRDLNLLDEEYHRAQRRAIRDINEWGTVDIEALTMSIRSRLTVELSYALTTLTLLSTMKGPTPGSGFPIAQCTDLLEEVLDLLEDEAFDGVADVQQHLLTDDTRIPRHRELVTMVHDTESLPFAGLRRGQGSGRKEQDPRRRPGTIVLTVTNIIRNLSVIPDNVQFLAKHERMLELVLRASGVVIPRDSGLPRPASPFLTLSEVLHVRKDAVHILSNVAPMVTFPLDSPPSDSTARTVTRVFELVASIIVEPVDAVPPTQTLKLSGIPFANCRPPSLPDITLDVFTRIAQLDQNRQVFSRVIPREWIWRLMESLVHRLPVSDSDFAFLSREPWLSYLEKATMAIYAIAFLSPPDLKKRIKSDRSLRFSQVMIRMVQRLLMTNSVPEARTWFMVTARRAIEAMKVVDDGEDAFDTSQSTQPTLAFGMGFGETGEMVVEKGTGMLAGRRDVTWDLLMQRDLDPVLFGELESLMRVD
ncbi:hypothetical protein PISMIDRAFT_589784 [Pisolithus microcarpus 441]|uniref:ARID domain-containing protein n=1 Tax=Pisolithus microcarpus 441 TaxID=765257 RepID=A0A0D0A9I8_9AGAM|nr:hypothetical protein PISMIDRAFT_589784 [Pisolithus microcarpus 441]